MQLLPSRNVRLTTAHRSPVSRISQLSVPQLLRPRLHTCGGTGGGRAPPSARALRREPAPSVSLSAFQRTALSMHWNLLSTSVLGTETDRARSSAARGGAVLQQAMPCQNSDGNRPRKTVRAWHPPRQYSVMVYGAGTLLCVDHLPGMVFSGWPSRRRLRHHRTSPKSWQGYPRAPEPTSPLESTTLLGEPRSIRKTESISNLLINIIKSQ
jgi:hypothetical protein